MEKNRFLFINIFGAEGTDSFLIFSHDPRFGAKFPNTSKSVPL